MDMSNIEGNAEQYLQGHYYEPEEHKTLNVQQKFHPNIRPDGFANENDHQCSIHERELRLYGFKLKTFCAVSSFALLFSALSVPLSVYSVMKYNSVSTELAATKEKRVCLPCNALVIQLQAWKPQNDAGDCCVKLDELISVMDQIADQHASEKMQAVQDQITANRPSGSGMGPRVFAHIGFNGVWSSTYPHCHMTDGLELIDSEKGLIRVMTAGYYYVYSQMTLNLNLPIGDNDEPNLRHEINTKRPYGSQGVPFLQRHEFIWQQSAQRSYTQQASYLGGVKYIQTNHTVHLTALNSERLNACNSKLCYLGLYKL